MTIHTRMLGGLVRFASAGLLLMASLWSGSQVLAAQVVSNQVIHTQVVHIGAVHFPPYVVRPEKGEDSGLLPRLVVALNAAQHYYRFVMVPTSVPRRYRDFEQGRIDIAMFENPAWGWKNIAYAKVDLGLEDAEVFVARRVPGRAQSYFDDLSDKRLAVFSGYHYGFAGFNTDPKYLAAKFNAISTYSHDSNLLMVARGRVDIAPVTRSYLVDFMNRYRNDAGQLLVSERVDQPYRHFALLRPGASIDAREFRQLMQRLREEGVLAQIFEPLQITVLPVAQEQQTGESR